MDTTQHAPPLGDDESNSECFLHKFVSEGIWKMSVVPLLSESLRDESLLEEFYKWESGISFSFAGAPDWLLTKFVEGRENLFQALMDPSFVEKGTELVKRRAAELPLSKKDLNRTTVGLIFAAVANSMYVGHFLALVPRLESSNQYRIMPPIIGNYLHDKDNFMMQDTFAPHNFQCTEPANCR